MIDLGIHGSSHGPVSGTDEEIRLNQTYSASAYVVGYIQRIKYVVYWT